MANNVSSGAAGALAGVLLLLQSPACAAGGPPAAMPPVVGANERVAALPHSGLAVNGFDPVTYFLGRLRPGTPGRELIWNGAAWRFASEANIEAFRRDPESFAPRVGGYDPVAVTQGHAAPADPTLFAVLAERLYLFRDEASRRRFLADPGLAERAEARWRDLAPRLAGD